MAIFPGKPGLAGLLKLRMMEVVVTTGATRRAKLHSNCHYQQTNTQLCTSGMPFQSPNQQHQSIEGKQYCISLKILNSASKMYCIPGPVYSRHLFAFFILVVQINLLHQCFSTVGLAS